MKVCTQSGSFLLSVPDGATDLEICELVQSKSHSIKALQYVNFKQRKPCIVERDATRSEDQNGLALKYASEELREALKC